MSNYTKIIELINSIEELETELTSPLLAETDSITQSLVDKLQRRLSFDKKQYYKKLDLLTD